MWKTHLATHNKHLPTVRLWRTWRTSCLPWGLMWNSRAAHSRRVRCTVRATCKPARYLKSLKKYPIIDLKKKKMHTLQQQQPIPLVGADVGNLLQWANNDWNHIVTWLFKTVQFSFSSSIFVKGKNSGQCVFPWSITNDLHICGFIIIVCFF